MLSLNAPEQSADLKWSRGAVLVCLGLILVLAIVLRVRGLGASVYGDEAYHFAAADREAAGQGISLAPNFPYRRALWFSEAVIACRHWFGDVEWAHRLPAFVASLSCSFHAGEHAGMRSK